MVSSVGEVLPKKFQIFRVDATLLLISNKNTSFVGTFQHWNKLVTMRFRFCGQNDCQDWILAQISLLSKLTSIKMKILCNECLNDIIDKKIDLDKVIKIGTDAKLDAEDMKACVAAVQFILSSAAKYSTDSETLSNELQQLGLPKEHSSSLCKVYSEHLDRLQEALRQQSLRLSRLLKVQYKIDTEFSGRSHKVKAPALQLSFETITDSAKEETKFYITHEKLSLLINELRQTLQMMDEMAVR